MTKSKAKYIGVGGCKAGWFSVGLNDSGDYEVNVYETFCDLLDYYDDACLVLVDIPIGLPCPGPRPRKCDTEARRSLGSPRAASVFRVPIREVAYMVSEGAPRGNDK